MRKLLTLAACLFLGGNLLASEGPTLEQGAAAGDVIRTGSHPANTVTALQAETARRIEELEAQRSAGGDEEQIQLQIIRIKAESEQRRLELLVQECLAAGRTEEAALAQAELERRNTPIPAARESRVLTFEEKQALGTADATAAPATPVTGVPSTTEGARR